MPDSRPWKEQFRLAPMFARLSQAEGDRILELVEPTRFPAGEVLFREGDPRQRMIMLLRGEVQLNRMDAYGASRHVVTMTRGDLLGEGLLIDGSSHSTTATVTADTEAAVLTADMLRPILEADEGVAHRILISLLQEIVGRLDQSMFRAQGVTLGFSSGRTREEHDLLGDDHVPSEAYFGIQTARALQNFDIGGGRLHEYPNLVRALGMVKKACALANRDCGALEREVAEAIAEAADEVIAGKLHHHFVVDMLQGGAGTSTNMNANEVIANRALEILGEEKGAYGRVHPNNHVNCSQSTNDVYPSALKLGMVLSSQRLIDSVRSLVEVCEQKADEFADVVKMGRTQLQDAVPMTLGQEFGAFAASLTQELDGLELTSSLLRSVNIGGTAIGTALNTPNGYSETALRHLREVSGLDLKLAPNLIEATQDTQAFVLFSSALKSLAVKISKICSDLRLLSSGPRAGLNEVFLPARQPGSSIMPGKVNPVIPEVVNQVAYRVIGNDLTVTMAAEAGQLQLNVMEPVIALSILESLKILANSVITLRHNCLEDIKANTEQCRHYVENSIGLVTALVPVLGYETTSKVATQALASGQSLAEVLEELDLLTPEVQAALAPERMV